MVLLSALQSVIGLHAAVSLPSIPSDNEKTGYGRIQLHRTAFLFDILDSKDPIGMVESENPISMEAAGQMFGFLLYLSDYIFKGNGRVLFIPKVQDMLAQLRDGQINLFAFPRLNVFLPSDY